MSRSRAAWLAGAVAVLLAAAVLLLRMRRADPEPVVATPAPVPLPPAPVLSPERAAAEVSVQVVAEPLPVEPAPRQHEPVERPLPTWVRVGIVVVALLAFFAVSLIATKQV
jgi:hypothetical protein